MHLVLHTLFCVWTMQDQHVGSWTLLCLLGAWGFKIIPMQSLHVTQPPSLVYMPRQPTGMWLAAHPTGGGAGLPPPRLKPPQLQQTHQQSDSGKCQACWYTTLHTCQPHKATFPIICKPVHAKVL
jgi:hypothetical protein